MSFANRLKQARKRQDLTQEQLSKRSGLSTYTIQRYEYGKLKPKKSTVAKLAAALGLSYTYTNSGEPYFYTFVDTALSPKHPEYIKAKKFNQVQQADALIDVIEDIKHMDFFSDQADVVNYKLYSDKSLKILKQELLENYEFLNEQGQQKLYDYSCDLLEIEKYRAKDTSKQESTPPEQNNTAPDTLLAAHQRTDMEPTKEGIQHDLDIMNDESNWD